MNYQAIQLYGGAISTKIPTGLLDASTIRQIPDTQEVFVNLSNNILSPDDSLIFDLMERVDHTKLENTATADDESNSLQLHLNEISELNGLAKFSDGSVMDYNNSSHWKLLQNVDVTDRLEKLNHIGNKAYIATAVAPSHKWGKSDQQTWLVLILGLVRHKKHDTDILISLNLPKLIPDELSVDKVEKIISSENADEPFTEKLKVCWNIVLTTMENLSIDDESLFG